MSLPQQQPEILNKNIGSGLSPIYGRVIENAKKVALIHAVGRNPANPEVEMIDIVFGFNLADSLAKVMIDAI